MPWMVGTLCALVPVVFTAVASAAAQILGFGDVPSTLAIAVGATVSAMIGLVIMARSPVRLADYGFRAPRNGRVALWFLPAIATIAIVVVTQGVHESGAVIAASVLMTVAVALNEEVWFRGIVLAVLRAKNLRTGIVGSSILFGVLHLANLAGGADLGASILQLLFAVLFGLVAAELVVSTGSLWPAIAWHAAWDLATLAGGDAQTGRTSIGVAIACAVMIAYAVLLWRPSVGATAGTDGGERP